MLGESKICRETRVHARVVAIRAGSNNRHHFNMRSAIKGDQTPGYLYSDHQAKQPGGHPFMEALPLASSRGSHTFWRCSSVTWS